MLSGRLSLALLLSILVVRSDADPVGPGVVATISQKAVTGWVQDFEGQIGSICGNLQLPDQDIHLSHGRVKLSNIHTHNCGNQNFSFQLTPNPGLQISASFDIMLAFNFHYNIAGLAGNGQCEFKMKIWHMVSGNLGVSSGKLLLSYEDARVDANGLWHDCNCNGLNIINVILDPVSRKVKDVIRDEGSKWLKDVLVQKAAPALSKITLDFPLSGDFALVRFDAQTVTYDKEANAIVLALQGDVVQKADMKDPEGTGPRSLPPWDAAFNQADVQISLSSWSLLTAVANYQRAGRLAIDVRHTDLPDHSPLQLNTSDVGVFAPGLLWKNNHKWMQIAMAVEEGSEVHVHADKGIVMDIPVGLRFQIVQNSNTLVEAFALKLQVTVAVDVTARSNTSGTFLFPNVTALKFPASVANSTVGPVFLLPKIKNFASFIVQKVGLPYVNHCIRNGYPLPNHPNVQFKNIQIGMREEFMVIASDVDLTTPSNPNAQVLGFAGHPADDVYMV